MSTNGKNAISALQELTQAKGQPLPIYVEEGSSPLFKCTVHVGGIAAIGYAPTKKAAKHESAENALKKLEALQRKQHVVYIEPSPTGGLVKPMENYVGKLNEYSSKKGFPYPDYDNVVVTVSGEFFYKCTFLEKTALGKGANKKDAKQNAAKRMLEMIKDQPDSFVVRSNILEKKSLNVDDKDSIINMYKKLSLNVPEVQTPKTATHVEVIPEINIIEQDSVDTLKAKLEKYGIAYSLEALQTDPCIMYLKILGTDLCFMAFAASREEATRRVLLDVLEVRNSGCLLNNNDLISFNH